ncbi:MAG: tripartite tricarboxylate transporter substrate binding protein [Betaproteobacteria bacterium]|nr:tripartite tricarboxylate transporter substrate binding protein [Betaproteobacteria bacterium]
MRFVIASLMFAAAATAFAQGYPSKPVRIVIPYAAGGGPDVQARQFGVKLSELLGQTVVLENKVGAAGVLAAQYVAQSAADGYTVLLGSNTHLIQKHLKPDLSFDPIADFVPVSNMASSPTVMVVRADHPAKSVQDVVSSARRNPGKMNYGSGGIGTSAHLAGATLAALGGFKAVHIPLKGSVEITLSLLRGDTDFAFPISSTGVPQVKSGKLRALAVTSAKRMSELPDVPTLTEVMKSDLAVQESWFGFWAPAKSPAEAVNVLHAATVKALADPQLRQQLESTGGIPAPSESPAAFAAFVKSENVKWAEIVKLSAAKAD